MWKDLGKLRICPAAQYFHSGASTPRIEKHSQVDIRMPLFIGVLRTVAEIGYQPRYPRTDRGLGCCGIHRHRGILCKKSNGEIMQFAATLLEVENTMLSEVSQKMEDK